MKSQVIRKRNLPEDRSVSYRVQLKPTVTLVIMIMMGMIFIVAKPYLFLSGIMMGMLGVFCLFVMPDGVLCEFTGDYLILYNRKSPDCMLVYWDDIVSWQYEKHASTDSLIIIMVDGSTETLECYSGKIRRYMKAYVPDKEVRTRTGRML